MRREGHARKHLRGDPFSFEGPHVKQRLAGFSNKTFAFCKQRGSLVTLVLSLRPTREPRATSRVAVVRFFFFSFFSLAILFPKRDAATYLPQSTPVGFGEIRSAISLFAVSLYAQTNAFTFFEHFLRSFLSNVSVRPCVSARLSPCRSNTIRLGNLPTFIFSSMNASK